MRRRFGLRARRDSFADRAARVQLDYRSPIKPIATKNKVPMKTTPPVSRLPARLGIRGVDARGLLSAPWQAATAAPVTSKQAAAVVTGWLSLDRTPLGETLGTSVQRVETFNDQSGNALYYVAYLDPSGFVIVAADDLVEPIVGFAGAGQFDPSENNPLGALVSNDLAGRVAYARQAGSTSPDTNAVQAQAKWQQLSPEDGGPVITPNGLTSVSDVRVAPFTQTTWNQQTAAGAGTAACYNYYTPPYGDGNTANYPAGCVATAMAQLMRYYQFPTTGVGSAAFHDLPRMALPATYYLHGGDGSGGPYVWSNMPLVPPANPTTAQCQAIGALVADAGATVNMAICQRRFLLVPARRQRPPWSAPSSSPTPDTAGTTMPTSAPV